ncbi:hypothetical protein HQ584_07295 [Patescibacteria group bacterium]|nr:hypothetical protein [Patescibacteria group bacterium]
MERLREQEGRKRCPNTVSIRTPEELIGCSSFDVIAQLPTFPWYIRGLGGTRIEPEITDFVLVDYDTWKPRKEGEIFTYVEVTPGQPLDRSRLDVLAKASSGRTVGLTSLVYFNQGRNRVHLPLLDMDLKRPINGEVLDWVKCQIREVIGIERGIILASGQEGGLHFIGTHRLLTDAELVTFVGLCLQTWLPDGQPYLVDPMWLGFSLTPMWHALEQKENPYDDGLLRFTTLRVSATDKKPKLPQVIDVL